MSAPYTMITRSHPLIVPQCSACIRRLAQTGIEAWRPPFAQQIRGKKKLAKKNQPDTVPARLLKDVRLWGRKGWYQRSLGPPCICSEMLTL